SWAREQCGGHGEFDPAATLLYSIFSQRTAVTAPQTWSCGAVWSARHPVKVEAAGSNPVRTASPRRPAPARARGPSALSGPGLPQERTAATPAPPATARQNPRPRAHRAAQTPRRPSPPTPRAETPAPPEAADRQTSRSTSPDAELATDAPKARPH